MTLIYEEEGELLLPLECQELAKEVILTCVDALECPYETEVSLLLTTDEEIHALNKKFRGIDRATDVLSFPMADYEVPGDFTTLEEQADAFNPETGELLLGDIVISKDRVLSQAEEYGHSVKREYAFLIAHSMLHLFGYDHIDEKDRCIMEQKQKDIMEMLQINRRNSGDRYGIRTKDK